MRAGPALRQNDDALYRSLLGEITYIEEILQAFEQDSVGLNHAAELIARVQRDAAELYRVAQS